MAERAGHDVIVRHFSQNGTFAPEVRYNQTFGEGIGLCQIKGLAHLDEELRNYLMAMEGRLTAGLDRLEAEQIKIRGDLNTLGVEFRAVLNAVNDRLMARLNNSEERILNRLATMEADDSNTKGFPLNDAAIATRR
jgi:uncharacterized protein YkuJ